MMPVLDVGMGHTFLKTFLGKASQLTPKEGGSGWKQVGGEREGCAPHGNFVTHFILRSVAPKAREKNRAVASKMSAASQ